MQNNRFHVMNSWVYNGFVIKSELLTETIRFYRIMWSSEGLYYLRYYELDKKPGGNPGFLFSFFMESFMEHDFTSGSVWKKLLLFAVPIFGANLLQALYGTVDLFVVGLFADASAVSAVSTGSMTMQTITGIITGLTMGCTVLLGQNIGKKDEAAAERTVGSALWLFVTVGILLAVIVAVLAVGIASVINAPAEAFSQTTDYIRICGIGIICIVMFNAIGGMFRGLGDARTPLALMGVACVVNIAGDFALVGALKMGVAGAALATVAVQGILSTFLVRIPVSYAMSKVSGVTLFQIGFATPLATVFGLILSASCVIYYERKRKKA